MIRSFFLIYLSQYQICERGILTFSEPRVQKYVYILCNERCTSQGTLWGISSWLFPCITVFDLMALLWRISNGIRVEIRDQRKFQNLGNSISVVLHINVWAWEIVRQSSYHPSPLLQKSVKNYTGSDKQNGIAALQNGIFWSRQKMRPAKRDRPSRRPVTCPGLKAEKNSGPQSGIAPSNPGRNRISAGNGPVGR